MGAVTWAGSNICHKAQHRPPPFSQFPFLLQGAGSTDHNGGGGGHVGWF